MPSAAATMIMITMKNKQQDERHGDQQQQQRGGDHHHGGQAMSVAYQIHRLQWDGIAIEVRYNPDWSPSYCDIYGYPLTHLEIEAVEPAKSPLPMTETGYRSHFGSPGGYRCRRRAGRVRARMARRCGAVAGMEGGARGAPPA